VLILKGVKALCFDALLQVLILKKMEGLSGITEKRDAALGKWRVASDLSQRTLWVERVARKRTGCLMGILGVLQKHSGYATPGILGKEAGSY